MTEPLRARVVVLLLITALAVGDAKSIEPERGLTVAALKNPDDQVVRIYGRYPRALVGDGTGTACQFDFMSSRDGSHEQQAKVEAKIKLLRHSPELADDVLTKFADYFLECDVSHLRWPKQRQQGIWQVTGVASFNGLSSGARMKIHELDRRVAGSGVAICTLPIVEEQEEMREWIDYHVKIGVNTFIMHVPQRLPMANHTQGCAHGERMQSEAAPRVTKPTDRITFQHHHGAINVVWVQHDWPADAWPAKAVANLVLSSCLYRLRHFADYVISMDTKEYYSNREYLDTRRPMRIRPLLEKYIRDKEILEVAQELYPKECQAHISGEYPSLFSLTTGETGIKRYVVRPKALLPSDEAVLLDSHVKWTDKIVRPEGNHFIKRIAAGEESVQRTTCAFGSEATTRNLAVLQLGV